MSASPPSRARTLRACEQCRRRKQRCDGVTVPCLRCVRVRKSCSFLRDGLPDPGPWSASAREDVLQVVQDELREMRESVDARLAKLEHLAGVATTTRSSSSSPTPEPASLALDLSAGTVSHPPMQILRGLYGARPVVTTEAALSTGKKGALDPVSRGIITLVDAQRFFDVFFAACHELAPCASKQTQANAAIVQTQSPFLFTAICLIGARYWEMDHPVRSTQDWLHPRYANLVAIFDEHMHRLTLRPTASDFTLEAVQALLLTIQWPALDGEHGRASRFNDAYAWSMIGIAMRVARYIDLEHCAGDPIKTRVWINLVSIDTHLTLTAGLPSSLAPPSDMVIHALRSSPGAQTGDVKLAGLAELIGIVQRAATACGDVSLHKLDQGTLEIANAELDNWDHRWSLIMLETSAGPAYRQQMPFTALRWYRLAINARPVGTALGDMPRDSIVASPPAVARAVDAAFQLIWQYSSEAVSERPERQLPQSGTQYTMNYTALSLFMFAVDAYWITHAYAAIFLVLMYDRGCIDAELVVRPYTLGGPPSFVAETTRLYRIIQFATSIFDGICQGAVYHPAMRYRKVVTDALHALERYQQPVPSEGIDDMLTALLDPEQDWTFLRDFIVPL